MVSDFKTIRKKIFQFCAYQERSTHQVIKKLQSYSISSEEVELLLIELQENHFLDDERYVKSFCRGKFRNCHWGKIKIEYELKKQNFSNHLIELGLKEIEENEYLEVIQKLALKKLQSLRLIHQDSLQKVRMYLYQKGFEWDSIDKALKNLKI